MERFRYYQVFILPLMFITLLAGCKGKGEGEAAAKQVVEDKPVAVEVAPARTQPVQRAVAFVGTLEAYEEAAVSSKLEVPVSRVLVDMGDRVAKDALLAKLDDEKYRIQVSLARAALEEATAKLGVQDEKDLIVEEVSYVKKAKAELDDAELNFKRMKELQEKGYVSRSQLDEAQSRYDVTRATYRSQLEYGRSLFAAVKTKRASLELAEKELRDTEVRSPFSGYVSKRSVDPGDFVKVGGEVARIVRVDPIRLKGDVPEVNAQEIKTGQEVKVGISAMPGKEYSGRISRISPSSSPESRAFTVEVLIPNGNAALKPGYFAEGKVLTRVDPTALTVPLNSLVQAAGITKVFVAENGKAVERVVDAGVRMGDMVEVKGGVKPGEQVIFTGMTKLYDGKAVNVRKAQ